MALSGWRWATAASGGVGLNAVPAMTNVNALCPTSRPPGGGGGS